MKNNNNLYGTNTMPFSASIQSETLLFVSGQGGIDPDTSGENAGDIRSQTIRTVENIKDILAQSGLTLDDVLKTNVYLTSRDNYELFNQVYVQLFSHPYPARTLIYCELNFGLLVEIDVIAKLRN